MWCRWWLWGGGGGDKGCYYLAPPLLYMDVKRKCHFLGISVWVNFFEPKCHQEDVSGGPLYLSSYPLKPICVGFPVALSQGKYYFWVTVGLPYYVTLF